MECVSEFCYLGDITGAGVGAIVNAVVRIRRAWKKFRELLLFLTVTGTSLGFRGEQPV